MSRNSRLPSNHNQTYMAHAAEQEKRTMSRVVDALGMPANNQPQPQGGFNPVGMFLDQFLSTYHVRLAKAGMEDSPTDCVNEAWEAANAILNKLGLVFVAPLSVGIKPPTEVHTDGKQ